jgi:rhamnosyltransferase
MVYPALSIVYLTKNGGKLFALSLASVLEQRIDCDYEVIAVDSGSTDGTLELLTHQPVRLYQIPPHEFNFGLTRDYGFSLARGEIVIALSQDCIPADDHWLYNLISPFSDQSVAVVQGVDVLPKDCRIFYWDRVRLFYRSRDSVRWLKNHNGIAMSFTGCAIRRSVWEDNRLGPIKMCDDKVFQKRLTQKGCRIVVAYDARQYHSHFYGVASLRKRSLNEGMGWREAGMKYSSLDMLLDMVNPLMYAGLVFGILTMRIHTVAELLFPLIRPYYLYKGNHSTKNYVR